MEKNEIKIDGIEYIRKDSIKQQQKLAPKNTKGMEYCIIRTYSAGVFAGYINRKEKGMERTIYNSRRLWYWQSTGLDLSTVAEVGVISSGCKFSEIRPEIDLTQVIEIQPCTEKSRLSIIGVPVWQKS